MGRVNRGRGDEDKGKGRLWGKVTMAWSPTPLVAWSDRVMGKRWLAAARLAPDARGGMNAGSPHRIELRLRELAQLFNSLDPSPFIERDLDADAEEFILGWSREVHMGHELKLVVHLATPPPADRAATVESAVRHYFAQRAEMKQREFRLLMRRGRTSLVVGVVFLALCFVLGELALKLVGGTFGGLASTSMTIVGWVAMWRPLEIYLYDWWPVREERLNLERLARMGVTLKVPPA